MYLCWKNKQDIALSIKLPKIATAQVIPLVVDIVVDKKHSVDGIVIWLRVQKENICS